MHWNLDTTHSAAEFAVKHLMIATVKGRFAKVAGTGETNPDGTLKSVEMTLDAASIDTNEPMRDEHLRSPDFFDVAKYPALTFKSTKVETRGSDIAITGDLSIRDVTKPITLKGEISGVITDPWGNPRTALAVSATLSRKEWGLIWNMVLEAGGFAVSDQVKISVDVQAVAVREAVKSAA